MGGTLLLQHCTQTLHSMTSKHSKLTDNVYRHSGYYYLARKEVSISSRAYKQIANMRLGVMTERNCYITCYLIIDVAITSSVRTNTTTTSMDRDPSWHDLSCLNYYFYAQLLLVGLIFSIPTHPFFLT